MRRRKRMTHEQLRWLARLGSITRLRQLEENKAAEEATIFGEFPELRPGRTAKRRALTAGTGRKWSAEQHRKFKATMAAKRHK